VNVLLCTTIVGLAGCQGGGDAGTGPQLPGNPPSNPQLKQAAFILDVNTSTREVKISPPTAKVSLSQVAPLGNGSYGNLKPSLSQQGIQGPDFSILAGDAVQLTASNYSASAIGASQPNKVTVKFDINITNRLSSVSLITPTFPVPPAGVAGVFLFPFSTNVTTTSGGVSVGGDGTDVIIDLPNTGNVAPSTDWDGSPFNFFNDNGCAAGSNDCYRYESFAQPLAAGGTSEGKTVGFDIDPTVSNFRARLIVAADLQNSGAALTGTISGGVTSPQRGALSGVTVTATPGTSLTGTSDAAGAYTIGSVPTGPKTLTLTSLPAGCTDPGTQSATVAASATSTVNFTVQCTAAVGSVTGTISRTGPATPSLATATATATPGAAGTSTASAPLGSASPTSYTITGVLIGTGTGAGAGTVALGNLPAGCNATPTSGAYTGLTQGGSVTGPSFTVDCQTPPAFYAYRNQWGTPTGGQVTLTLSFDPTTLNNAAVNGAAADDIKTFQAQIAYNSARLTFTGCANAATGANGFTNINANEVTPGTISLLNFKNGAGAIVPVTLGVCTFTINAGSAAAVSTTTTFSVIDADGTGDTVTDLIPNTQKTEATGSF
jgi:hypothetical protein